MRLPGGSSANTAPAYERALALVPERDLHLESCHADALLCAGRYQHALDAFGDIETGESALGAWVAVKRRAVAWVIEATGISSQVRQWHEANELAGELNANTSKHRKERVRRRAWELDAASPLGWFNSARDFLDEGDEGSAMLGYLTTAVMQEGDVEA